MNLDVYTQHIPLTQKARFWGNWVSALKGGKDMCAAPEPHIRHFYPSIVETMPGADSRLKNEFGRLEERVLCQFSWEFSPSNWSTQTPFYFVLSVSNDNVSCRRTWCGGLDVAPVFLPLPSSRRQMIGKIVKYISKLSEKLTIHHVFEIPSNTSNSFEVF